MKLFAIAVPIVPGKTSDVRSFGNALMSTHNKGFQESRQALGVHERAFLQTTPHGDFVIVTLEGDNPQEAFAKFGEANNEFTDWFVESVKESHGIDLRNLPDLPLPELIADSKA